MQTQQKILAGWFIDSKSHYMGLFGRWCVDFFTYLLTYLLKSRL